MERRAFPGDIRVLVSSELERRGFLAAFTERGGGVSAGAYSSLNLGMGIGDAAEAVRENRRRVTEALGVTQLVTARQVHGTAVASVDRPEAGVGEADALTTPSRSIPLGITTADCVALALASEREGRLAAIHVGWRGLAGGLIQAALHLFEAPADVAAAIGPAVGPCHYEVGPEVVEAVNNGTNGAASVHRTGGGLRLDIPATVEGLLRDGGVVTVEVEDTCTACEPSRFFSHRRDGRTGRQALVAVRL